MVDVFKALLKIVDNDAINKNLLVKTIAEELEENIEEYEVFPILEKSFQLKLLNQMDNGLLMITKYGRQVLQNTDTNYQDLWSSNGSKNSENPKVNKEDNPFSSQYYESLNLLINAYTKYSIDLRKYLKSLLMNMNEYKFEALVIDTLVGAKEAPYGLVTKKSGDGGIDGLLFQTPLMQGEIPVQVKRYAENNLVQEQEIRDFIGSWSLKHNNGAYFVTTSSYTNKAALKAKERGIILIDGNQLIDLMIMHKIGIERKEGLEIFYTPLLHLFD